VICGIQSDAMAPMAYRIAGSYHRPAVLVSEDHEDVLTAIGLLLKNNGIDSEFVKSPAETLAALRRRRFDALLLDLNYSRDTTSGAEGLELLSDIQALDSTVPIIVMTAWGTIELAVEAMHRGASDFVQKPWENARLLEVLRQQIERARKLRESLRNEQFELEDAAEIQRAMLPTRLAAPDGLTISAVTRSVRIVSGDYYDVIRLDERRSAICIADVMGKGVGAALMMSHLQATVRMLAPKSDSPRDLCSQLNEVIATNGFAGKFISFFYAVIDLQKMQITYTNAGHNWPILARRDGHSEWLKTDDAVLGTFRNWNYRQREMELRQGDRLVLFTDGITECADAIENEFGEHRLRQLVSENVQLSAEKLEQLILSSAQAHCSGAFGDDATLMVAAVR
jgi:sigma-B regulation protein RsbU (phosphoserine phosphatase)